MIFDSYNNLDPKINRKYISSNKTIKWCLYSFSYFIRLLLMLCMLLAADAQTHRDVHSHDSGVNHLLYTSDGLFILSSGMDRRIRRWDAISGLNTLINYDE